MTHRPRLQYAIAAILFAMAAFYQIKFSAEVLRVLFFPSQVVGNILSFEDGLPVLKSGSSEAQNAGLKAGDTVLAINGKPFTGQAVLGQELAASRPGQTLFVTVKPAQGPQKTAQVLLTPYAPVSSRLTFNVLQVVLNLLMPILSLALG